MVIRYRYGCWQVSNVKSRRLVDLVTNGRWTQEKGCIALTNIFLFWAEESLVWKLIHVSLYLKVKVYPTLIFMPGIDFKGDEIRLRLWEKSCIDRRRRLLRLLANFFYALS